MTQPNACIDCAAPIGRRAKRCNPCRYADVARNQTGKKRFQNGARPARAMPADFPKYASVESLKELRARFSAGTVAVQRWREQIGVTGKFAGLERLAPPSDIVAVAASLSYIRDVARHYGRSQEIAARWLRESGATLAPPKTQAQVAQAGVGSRYARTPIVHDRRDYTRAGQAADYLRRFGPVVRCDAKGRYKADGDHWRRGSTVLTADEVVARAERQGWSPDAWARIAA